MCKYEEIEGWRLSNGKTIREINNAVHAEVERIYLEAWAKGISVPYFEDGWDTYYNKHNRSSSIMV